MLFDEYIIFTFQDIMFKMYPHISILHVPTHTWHNDCIGSLMPTASEPKNSCGSCLKIIPVYRVSRVLHSGRAHHYTQRHLFISSDKSSILVSIHTWIRKPSVYRQSTLHLVKVATPLVHSNLMQTQPSRTWKVFATLRMRANIHFVRLHQVPSTANCWSSFLCHTIKKKKEVKLARNQTLYVEEFININFQTMTIVLQCLLKLCSLVVKLWSESKHVNGENP